MLHTPSQDQRPLNTSPTRLLQRLKKSAPYLGLNLITSPSRVIRCLKRSPSRLQHRELSWLPRIQMIRRTTRQKKNTLIPRLVHIHRMHRSVLDPICTHTAMCLDHCRGLLKVIPTTINSWPRHTIAPPHFQSLRQPQMTQYQSCSIPLHPLLFKTYHLNRVPPRPMKAVFTFSTLRRLQSMPLPRMVNPLRSICANQVWHHFHRSHIITEVKHHLLPDICRTHISTRNYRGPLTMQVQVRLHRRDEYIRKRGSWITSVTPMLRAFNIIYETPSKRLPQPSTPSVIPCGCTCSWRKKQD